LYFLLSVVMNLIYFGTKYFFNWKHDLVRLANSQREQTLVKYNALQNQLNPHFLFNALTSLNSLILKINNSPASFYNSCQRFIDTSYKIKKVKLFLYPLNLILFRIIYPFCRPVSGRQ